MKLLHFGNHSCCGHYSTGAERIIHIGLYIFFVLVYKIRQYPVDRILPIFLLYAVLCDWGIKENKAEFIRVQVLLQDLYGCRLSVFPNEGEDLCRIP